MQAEQTSFLFGANAPFIEELHARYLADPSRVDAEWRTFFEALADDKGAVLAEVRGASWAPNGARVIDVPEAPVAANKNAHDKGKANGAALAGRTEAEWNSLSTTFQTRPPMPWPSVHAMTEVDRVSLYRFIRALPGDMGNPAPDAAAPGQEPSAPYVVFAPPTLPRH